MNQNQTLHWFACVGGGGSEENNAIGGNHNENLSYDNDNLLDFVGDDEGIVLQLISNNNDFE